MHCRHPQLLYYVENNSGRKQLQNNEFNSEFHEKNLPMENVFVQIEVPETDLPTYKYSASSISKYNGNKLKRSCQKQGKIQQKVKSAVLSKKECIENKLSQRVDKIQFENELFCIVCNLKFSCHESLKDHKDENVFLCRLCTEEFKTHDDLENHFFAHKKIKCKVCKEEFFGRKDLFLHKSKMHTARKFECTACLKSFTTRYDINRHMNLFHNGVDSSYGCAVCGKSFKVKYQLKQHLLQAHVVYEHLECKFCYMMYLGPYKLQSHIKQIHLDSEENSPVSCSTCGKVFKKAKHLIRHQETHDNIESLCEICGKSIKTKSLMLSHMLMQHSKTGTFTCRICNEQFGVKKELQMHQRKHAQKRSTTVFCEICGKEYKNSLILKRHKETHADERPFKCEVCGATFKQSVALRTHRRVHSSVDKYTCSGCGNTFRWKQTFDKHIIKCRTDDSNNKNVVDK